MKKAPLEIRREADLKTLTQPAPLARELLRSASGDSSVRFPLGAKKRERSCKKISNKKVSLKTRSPTFGVARNLWQTYKT